MHSERYSGLCAFNGVYNDFMLDNGNIETFKKDTFHYVIEEDKANIILNLNNIKDKYMNLLSNSYPVIYAIKGRNEWFDSVDFDSPMWFTQIDLQTNSHIPPESILAKVEFLDGFTTNLT